jgi:hypothetical protein
VLHELSVWVEVVNDRICIAFVTGCEDHQLKMLREFSEEFLCPWADVEGGHHEPASMESDWDLYLMRLGQFFEAVH